MLEELEDAGIIIAEDIKEDYKNDHRFKKFDWSLFDLRKKLGWDMMNREDIVKLSQKY